MKSASKIRVFLSAFLKIFRNFCDVESTRIPVHIIISFVDEEIKDGFLRIYPSNSPSLNGFALSFNQVYWNIIKSYLLKQSRNSNKTR